MQQIPFGDYARVLGRYLRHHRLKIAALLVLLLAGTALQLIGPQIVARFVDSAEQGQPINLLLQLAGMFVVVAISEQIVRLVSAYLNQDVAWRATNDMRADLFEHVLKLDAGFHQENTAGNMVERVDGDIGQLARFFSEMISSVLANGLLLLGILVFFLTQVWQVGLVYVAFSLIALFLLAKIRDIAVTYWDAAREASADMQGFIEEHLLGLEDIRSRGAEEYVMQKLYSYMHTHFIKRRSALVRGALVFSMIMVLFTTAVVMIFGIGAYLYSLGAITIGTMYLYYRYVEMLRDPLQQLSKQLEYLQQAGASLKRVQTLLNRESTLKDGAGVTFPDGALSVEFKNVSFSYTDDNPVLRNVSFTIPAGESMGLVGRTGSGKTTAGRLIFRLYDVDSGTIYLGDNDIREATLADLRRHITMVTQDVQLFDASVRDNLTFFDETISDEQIMTCLRDLELQGWLDGLPNGLDTILNSSNSGLSAGEAQLLSFARAFLQNPSVVILDEASSRLDPVTEQLIQRATGDLLNGRTAIIIAHRLATLDTVDYITVLDDGQVVESGRNDALRGDDKSRFAHLLQTHDEGVVE